MRKKLTTLLGLVCALVLAASLTACFGGESVTYTLNSSSFDKAVVYNQEIDFSDFVIEGSDGNKVNVTSSMVSGWDTGSVGSKTLTITFEDMVANVDYTVKYEVDFVVDGEIIDTQYVISASELIAPDGYVFEIPSTLTGNVDLVGTVKVDEPTNVEIFVGDNANELPVGASGVELPVTVKGTSNWNADVSNENVEIMKMNGLVLIAAKKVGVTDLTISAGDKAVTKTIVIKPENLAISEGAKTYGIENVFTFGRTSVSGAVSKLALTASCAKIGEGFAENVSWTADDERAVISDNGEITLAEGTGVEIVTFTADFFGVKASFDVRCVFDGVNVSNYEDLYQATKAQKVIVLGADIAFPTVRNAIHVETIHTTYDDTYYKNISKESDATINVLLQFKNDLYGNGYEINAHNATLGLLDATGKLTADSIFRGPLHFVGLPNMTQNDPFDKNNKPLASVKGQDNVCFALYEGVTVNNTILKGANLEADSDGYLPLTQLDYAGTTVEVFGDNVTIEYSRIMNGRTVLRVFGDANDVTKVITLNIKNSVLSGAREFIVRMGSNAFKDGATVGSAGYLKEALDLIGIKKNAANKPANYEKDYIKTFVNVTNCVFKDAGIFAVGMDSHFAGEALRNGSGYVSWFEGFNYWHDLAKTSYGAKLTFNGEVKMYNWKPLGEVDSSTLIEVVDLNNDDVAAMIDFNVEELVMWASNQEDLKSIVVKEGDYAGYIHAGIAFFGGGRNYCLFEDNTVGNGLGLNGFEVSLDDVGKQALVRAAGCENFYFNIYSGANTHFTPEMQENMSTEEMYACIYNK